MELEWGLEFRLVNLVRGGTMTENEFLEYMRAKAKDLKTPPNPLRAHKPKIIRMESSRMRTVQRGTSNTTRAVYQTAEQAKRNTVTGEPEFTTREVGPGDVYNKTGDYRLGKGADGRVEGDER